jgi:hypothetical protein
MLRPGRSRVRFPIGSLNFSSDVILTAAHWPWGSTQTLREISTRNLTEDKGRPARKAVCEPIVYKIWEPRRLTSLWTSTSCHR